MGLAKSMLEVIGMYFLAFAVLFVAHLWMADRWVRKQIEAAQLKAAAQKLKQARANLP